jgi:DNA-binding transcriptional LysR family regulator
VIEPIKPRRLYLPCWPGHPLLAIGPTVEKVLALPLVTALPQGRAGEVAATETRAVAMDAARRIVRQTDALFPATASMLAADIAAGHVATLDFDSPAQRTSPAIVRLSERTLSPAAIRFLAIVRGIEAELVDVLPGA